MLTEVALQHRVIPGIAEFARGGLPSPAATDDGNEWVDGLCWLYCGQRWTRVHRIGPASAARIAASLMLAAEIDIKICRTPSGTATLGSRETATRASCRRSGRSAAEATSKLVPL
ncbi:hypothetical protein ACIOWM_04745 [Streptomyces anulatus]